MACCHVAFIVSEKHESGHVFLGTCSVCVGLGGLGPPSCLWTRVADAACNQTWLGNPRTQW